MTSPTKQEALAALDEWEPSGDRELNAFLCVRSFLIESTATGLDAKERAVVERSVKLCEGWLDGNNDAHERVQFAIAVGTLLAARAGKT